MENLTPTLILLWDVKRSLEKGQSVSIGIKNFLKRKRTDKFFIQVENWFMSQNSSQSTFDKKKLNNCRKYLLQILEQGLRGDAILQNLTSYESEVLLSCEDEIQRHIAKLPILLLVPLMCLIFPALMLLLIGPLLNVLQF